MATTDRARVRSVTLALALLLLSGCAGRVTPVPPAKVDVTPPELPQTVRAQLSRPGIHPLADGMSLVVGTLHYRDVAGGYWAVDVRDRYRGDEPTADIMLANASRLATDLQALDGQYVGVGGRLDHAAYSEQPATRRIAVSWLGIVSDLAHASPTNRYTTGLWTLEDGTQYASGWLERTGGAMVMYFTRPGSADRAPALTVEASAGSYPPLPSAGSYADVFGSVVGTSGGLPAFHVERVGGWSPAGTGGQGWSIMGAPPRWRHVEPAGFKDAPHGRKRAVGILRRTEDGRYTVGGVPWLVTEAFPAAAALQGTSAVNVQLEAAVDRYVAVVGLPVGTLAVPVRRLGLMPDVRVPLLVPESVTVVTTMTPTADELMLVRGG